MSYGVSKDPWMEHAKRVIFADYGVRVSLEAKNKDLHRFGRNDTVQLTSTSIMTLPTGQQHETYVASNLINSIISTDAGDTEEVKVEGHTLAGSDFTFVVQTVTLNGQTAVALPTPLARVVRVYNNSATTLAGVVSVTETDTYTAGVPDTATKVHCQIRAGQQSSEKAGTTISSTDFWVVTSIYADMMEKTAIAAEIDLEMRLYGKSFLTIADLSASENHRAVLEFRPYLIVPPNSDVRLTGSVSTANKAVSGGIMGSLLKA